MLEHGIYNMYAINTPTKKGPTILKNFPIAPIISEKLSSVL